MADRDDRRVSHYAHRRGFRVGTGVARAAYGAAKALYKNREALKKAAKKLWKSRSSKSRLQRPARKIYSVASSKARSDPAATGNELTTYKTTVGRFPKPTPNRLLRLAQAGMSSVIYRFQGLTNFDTNVGFYPIANRVNGDLTNANIPLHVYDLSTFANVGPIVSPAHGFFWTGLTAGATPSRQVLQSQKADGTINTSGNYVQESASGSFFTGGTGHPYAPKALHDWVQIKLLLYGARKRGTTYYIDLVQCKNEFVNFAEASSTNSTFSELIGELERPLIYSPLQQNNPGIVNKNLKFVKRWKFYIPGGSADDLDTIGKVKQVTIFHKIGKIQNFQWKTDPPGLGHQQDDGADFTQSRQPLNSPYPGAKLFLMIRAFSPERGTVFFPSDFNITPANPLTEPSYDLMIRNKWSIPG